MCKASTTQPPPIPDILAFTKMSTIITALQLTARLRKAWTLVFQYPTLHEGGGIPIKPGISRDLLHQYTDLCDIPDMMEYVKVYRETLSSGLFDRRGIIFLYNPSSRINSHTTKRYPPISVGDVGFFDSNGGFDTHFNVLDKKINKDSDYDQPPGLLDFKEYLVSQGRKDTDILDYQADGLIRGRRNKRSISENMIVKDERMAEFVVENMDLPCASVYMPQTVDRISIRKPNPFSFFEDFIKIYGAMWIEFAKPRGVGRTKTQPVCVIGEVNRTPVWASASSLVPESLASAKVSQPDPASDVLVWSDISDDSLFTQAGPPIDCLVEGKAAPPRECIAVSAWMLQPPSQFARSMSELTGPLRSSLSRGRSRAASLK
ncbi:hypothetical protein NLJ89_g9565 [Agrocybe chaxingu]|uniref:Uncharacterized protein n=1 Tax=Agrocybe chaxingu TaxID=84603 RepID=A0A9W8MRP9_9AGAR|nr:hypothetical protein NLJ89_g9565 [Agrocybe chaxingu]